MTDQRAGDAVDQTVVDLNDVDEYDAEDVAQSRAAKSLPLFGGIEFGGTKTVCAVGYGDGTVLDEVRFPTGTNPPENIAQCVEFFRKHGPIEALGVGTFGPCDPNPLSPTYGYITTTPKPGWANYNVVGALEQALPGVPIGFSTDVNVAALGELIHGAGKGLTSIVYITIGTGIGGGAIVGSQLLGGLVHPEMGHIRIPRPQSEIEQFAGICAYHGDCFEGIASGPALEARWGTPAQDIGPENERHSQLWDLEADYVAYALHNFILTLSPQLIVIGGGVGERKDLHKRLRKRLLRSLNGYVPNPTITERIKTYIVPPALGNQSGGLGAIELARRVAVMPSSAATSLPKTDVR